ncbi:MAG: shikimate kinase [Planctomycetia bacterium]
MPRITLIGYRGTGKSTVAALLGDILGCGWCDADVVLEKKLGCSIAALVRERGEPVFRDEEAVVLGELLEGFSGVLSTGGGAVLRAANREALRKLGRPVVWLTAPADVVRRRLAADPATADRRPALAASPGGGPLGQGDPLAEVARALDHREPFYRECADFQVDTSIATPAAVAIQVADWLRHAWPGAEGATP